MAKERVKALLVAYHNSSAESMKAIAQAASFQGLDYEILATEPAADVFKNAGLAVTYHLPIISVNEDTVAGAINSSKPDVIALGTSKPTGDVKVTLEQLATSAAKAKGIPTASFLDYIGTNQRVRYRAEGADYLPDVVVAPDSWTRAAMINGENFPGEVFAAFTGNPQYDKLNELKKQWNYDKTTALRKKLGIGEDLVDSKLFTFVGGCRVDRIKAGDNGWDATYVDALCAGLQNSWGRGNRDFALMLRPHPREFKTALGNWEEVYRIAAKHDFPVVNSTVSHNSEEVALVTDITVISRSNIGTTCTLMDQRVISLQVPENPKNDDLGVTQMGVVPVAFTSSKASKIIHSIIFQPDDFWVIYDTRKQDFGLANEGKATERAIDLLKQMAN